MASDPWFIRDAKGRERPLNGIERDGAKTLSDVITEVKSELHLARARYDSARLKSPTRKSDGAPTSAAAKAAWDQMAALQTELGCLDGRQPANRWGQRVWYQRMLPYLTKRGASMPHLGRQVLGLKAQFSSCSQKCCDPPKDKPPFQRPPLVV